MNLNKARDLILMFAAKNGVSPEELSTLNKASYRGLYGPIYEGDWSLSWESNLDEEFKQDIEGFKLGLDLYDEAMARGDFLTAQVGLLRASEHAKKIKISFDNLHEGVTKVLYDKRFQWPVLPEGYELPDRYQLEPPKK